MFGFSFENLRRKAAEFRLRPFRKTPDLLDILLWLSGHDSITLHQLYEGVLAIGGTGSGKSSTMAHLMRALMLRGVAMQILTAKADDFTGIKTIAEESGRGDDLIRFAPGEPHTFDFLDFELRSPGASPDTAGALMTDIVDFASQTRTQQSNEPFFPLMSARQMRMAITAIWKAYQRCSVADIYRFCTSLPTTTEQAADPAWQATSYAVETLAVARDRGEDDDLRLAGDFALCEWPQMSDRTQGGVHAQTMTVLAPFMTGVARKLVASGVTSCSPADVLAGKILVIDLPVLVYRESGQFVQLAWKLSMIRAALRRVVTPDSIPVCIWADEAQLHALPKVDSMTQAVARSHRLINVAITQSDNLLVAAMRSREEAFAWCSNLMTKFIFASGDWETMQRFSWLAGQSRQLVMHGTGGARKGYDPIGDLLGEPQGGSVSFSEQWLPNIRPELFGLLRKGGPENGYVVDCYVTQSGRRFSNGRTFLPCSFEQRR